MTQVISCEMTRTRSLFALLLTALICGQAYCADVCTIAPRSDRVVSVKDKGAVGDGVNDDTRAIQSALNEVTRTGGTVSIPAGTFLVDAVAGLRVGSNTTILLAPEAVIKAVPNSSPLFSILNIVNADNVAISGGTLEGERAHHRGVTGEWGMGMTLRNATNVTIKNVISKNNWGDGFYVSNSRDIRFCSVVADSNRRQGMSIVSGSRILIFDSVFSNTRGTPPQAGLDIEPNEDGAVSDVRVVGSTFKGNAGGGMVSTVPYQHKNATLANIEITENLFEENARAGVAVYNNAATSVTHNIFKSNLGSGIFLDPGTRTILVTANRIAVPKGAERSAIVDKGKNDVFDNRVEY